MRLSVSFLFVALGLLSQNRQMYLLDAGQASMSVVDSVSSASPLTTTTAPATTNHSL